jgi:hypothetical protein
MSDHCNDESVLVVDVDGVDKNAVKLFFWIYTSWGPVAADRYTFTYAIRANRSDPLRAVISFRTIVSDFAASPPKD